MGYSTQSLSFNGTNQYGDAGDNYDFGYADVFSITLWFKTTRSGWTEHLICKQNNVGGWFVELMSNGQIKVRLVRASDNNYWAEQRSTTLGLADGAWHLLIVSNDGAGNLGISIDGGALEEGYTPTISDPGSTYGTGGVRIARYGTLGTYSPILLDEIAFYNRVLTSGERTWMYGGGNPSDLKLVSAPSGLQSWWRCGEKVQGAIMPDAASGEAYNPLNKSLDLNNDTVNEYVSFGSPSVWGGGQAFTLTAWIKGTGPASGQYHTIINRPRVAANDLGVMLQIYNYTGTSCLYLALNAPFGLAGYKLFAPNPAFGIEIFDGNWHQVGVTFPGDATYPWDYNLVSFFCDGQISGTYYGSGSPPQLDQAGTAICVGARQYATYYDYYVGQLCHASIHTAGVDAAAVTKLYNGGTPSDLLGTGMPSGLDFWCTLGDGCAIGAGNCPDLSGSGYHGTTANVESGDFITDAPYGGAPFTLYNSPTAQGDVPSTAFTGEYLPLSFWEGPHLSAKVGEALFLVPGGAAGGGVTTYFKMRGRESFVAAPGYVTWIVSGEPDFDGSVGYATGTPTPSHPMIAGSAQVVARWEE